MLSFAAPLKDMMKSLGVPHEAVYGEDKEEPLAMLGGRTARHAMQTLGTEWGRQLIWSDLWVFAWRKQAKFYGSGGWIVVADDMRFPNEAAAIRALGGIRCRVDSPDDLTRKDRHVSEERLPESDMDLALWNDRKTNKAAAQLAAYILTPANWENLD